jgi:hypothetical protein
VDEAWRSVWQRGSLFRYRLSPATVTQVTRALVTCDTLYPYNRCSHCPVCPRLGFTHVPRKGLPIVTHSGRTSLFISLTISPSISAKGNPSRRSLHANAFFKPSLPGLCSLFLSWMGL